MQWKNDEAQHLDQKWPGPSPPHSNPAMIPATPPKAHAFQISAASRDFSSRFRLLRSSILTWPQSSTILVKPGFLEPPPQEDGDLQQQPPDHRDAEATKCNEGKYEASSIPSEALVSCRQVATHPEQPTEQFQHPQAKAHEARTASAKDVEVSVACNDCHQHPFQHTGSSMASGGSEAPPCTSKAE